jgi:hypothetical protein
MKKLKSLMVLSGVAGATVLALAAPAAASPGDHSGHGSYAGAQGHGHDDDGDNNGILNGNEVNFCSLIAIIAIVDC